MTLHNIMNCRYLIFHMPSIKIVYICDVKGVCSNVHLRSTFAMLVMYLVSCYLVLCY